MVLEAIEFMFKCKQNKSAKTETCLIKYDHKREIKLDWFVCCSLNSIETNHFRFFFFPQSTNIFLSLTVKRAIRERQVAYELNLKKRKTI